VIDEIARTVLLGGKVKGAARRALAPIRLTLLMTLMPDADYAEVTAALLGGLPLLPWQRPDQVPTATVASPGREGRSVTASLRQASAVVSQRRYRTVSGPRAAKLTRRPAALGWAVLLVSHRPFFFGRVPVMVMTAVPLPVAPANAPVLWPGSTV
jgi:hypothetical protein